jgi:hypothetical protein
VVIDLKIRRDDIIDDIDEFQLAKEIRYLNGIGVLNKHFGEHMEILLQDTITRIVTAKFVNGEAFDRVPIYQFHPPDELCTKRDDLGGQALRTVIKVTLCGLPTPDENCAWEDILEFRAEGYEKRWGFRRFLHTLATKSQTEAEIRDDLEWTLKDYTNAMHIHHIKASQSFFEVYLLPVIELVEDLAKFNWSKLPKAPST